MYTFGDEIKPHPHLRHVLARDVEAEDVVDSRVADKDPLRLHVDGYGHEVTPEADADRAEEGLGGELLLNEC